MDQPLPFQSLSNKKFGDLYNRGRPTLEEGKPDKRNEWTRAILISLRQCKKSRSFRNLGLLLIQPADIIYEILCHLHPLDLYHLQIAAGKSIPILSEKISTRWVWSMSFQRNPEIPRCPEDIPYTMWADLLFGAYICESCGKLDTLPNWITRRRCCKRCVYLRYSYFLDPASEGFDLPMMGSEEAGSLPLFYFQEAADRYAAYLSNEVAAPASYTKKALRDRMKLHPMGAAVPCLMSTSSACQTWVMNTNSLASKQEYEQTNLRDVWLKQRLIGLGFDDMDIENATYGLDAFEDLLNLKPKHAFSALRKAWRNHLPKIETTLAPITRSRLESEESYRIEMRGVDLVALYKSVQPMLFDSQPFTIDQSITNGLIPAQQELVLYEPFRTLVLSWEPLRDETRTLDISMFLKHFGELIRSFTFPRDTMGQLARQSSMIVLSPSCRQYAAVRLDSPAAVFNCMTCNHPDRSNGGLRPLIMWRSVLEHVGDHTYDVVHSLEVSERGLLTGVAVMDVLSLDPCLATVESVKGFLGRFVCLCCPELIQVSMDMDWEDCIYHFIDFSGDLAHAQPSLSFAQNGSEQYSQADLCTVFLDLEH